MVAVSVELLERLAPEQLKSFPLDKLQALFSPELAKQLPIKAGYNGPGAEAIAAALQYHAQMDVVQNQAFYNQRSFDLNVNTGQIMVNVMPDGSINRQYGEIRAAELWDASGKKLGRDVPHALRVLQMNHQLNTTGEIDAQTLAFIKETYISAHGRELLAPYANLAVRRAGIDAIDAHLSDSALHDVRPDSPAIMAASADIDHAIAYLKGKLGTTPAAASLLRDDESRTLSEPEIAGLNTFLGVPGTRIDTATLDRLQAVREAVGLAELKNGSATLSSSEFAAVAQDALKPLATPVTTSTAAPKQR